MNNIKAHLVFQLKTTVGIVNPLPVDYNIYFIFVTKPQSYLVIDGVALVLLFYIKSHFINHHACCIQTYIIIHLSV